MKLLLLLPLLLLSFGCAQNHFNVPVENFADKVKVLGVAPIIIDVDSDIKYPQKDQLVSLVADMNRKYEPQLIRKLKETANFYTVALLGGDPQAIFGNLFFRRETRDDATIQYNKYFWKNDELRDYIQKNNLDAVMLIVVSGLNKNERIFSSNLLSSVTGDYNYLIMSAQILDANGTVLWEYPNFRGRILTYYPMINLEYPDFSEAEANLTNEAKIKFKTIDGIKLTLDQKRKDLLLRETQESQVYGKQFDEMLALIKYDSDSEKKEKSESPANGEAKPVEKSLAPAQETQKVPDTVQQPAPPAVDSPKVEAPNVTKVPVPDTPKEPAPSAAPPTDQVVPATGSTL